jgi:hypothetical protein
MVVQAMLGMSKSNLSAKEMVGVLEMTAVQSVRIE